MIPVHGAHVDILTIEAYAARLVDADAEAAIECHLICCESCRGRIAAASGVGDLPGVESCRLQSIWDAVVEAIDAPERSLPSLLRSRRCSQWHRLRRLLAQCVMPAGRMVPVARRALVTVMALLAVPMTITVSGSTSLFALQPFDTMDTSGDRVSTVGAARASTHGTMPAVGAVASCTGDTTGCPVGEPPSAEQSATEQPLCAPADLAFAVDWFSDEPGHGTLRVTNISETACILPAVIDVQLVGLPPEPEHDSAIVSSPPSSSQAYYLSPPRPAESHLSWTPWCGAPTSATVAVGWGGGTSEVTGRMPDSPTCPPAAGRPVLSAGQLRPVAEIRSGLQAL